MLGNNEIQEEIFDFIVEYIKKENICFAEIFTILDRIGDYNTKEIKEKLILSFIAKNTKIDGFDKYHVMLLIEYAKLFNEYPYQFIKEAEKNCDLAQEFYLQYELQDNYIQSLLYETKAEILSNDKDYEDNQITTLRKKCEYHILAEHQLQKQVMRNRKLKYGKMQQIPIDM